MLPQYGGGTGIEDVPIPKGRNGKGGRSDLTSKQLQNLVRQILLDPESQE